MKDNILKDKFSEFYLNEYKMLTEAHFQTSQKITSFFQYALLIFSAPIVLLTAQKGNISDLLKGSVFVFIGIVGILVMLYLSQLRAEALLYARNINKIRKSIYSYLSNNNANANEIENLKVLLTQDKKPKYFDVSQFIFVVLVLGVFDSFYFAFGVYKMTPYIFPNGCNQIIISILFGLIWFVIHLVLYKCISNYNENGSGYFKRIIGVDIDGVLNKHEEQFTKIYNKNNKDKISIDDITTLPVSKSGVINRSCEQSVFKTEEYWEGMPPVEDASIYITEEMKNKLGYKIHIFTWRAWTVPQNSKSKFSIKTHTKKWLISHNIKYDKLNFEEGNIDMPISVFSTKYRTRYFYAAKRNIKYFIEDNFENAEKLSNICKYVFLVNHKYNENKDIILPYNIIRVDNISEVFEWIKKLD